ncbi:SprT family zinc-dependent metalloprotease [Viridibacterium curvum]|uniref:SprT family zinc-dependent metalloprotease n=1 Tax=Viridibacterium curvum TaxID=1101404 RepID=A0ABP9QUN2_9RHOO
MSAGQVRQIVLKGRLVDYTLHRRARRTLGMTIDDRGITVSIPTRASIAETERFLLERSNWVVEKLAEWAARPKPASFEVADGTRFPMLGQTCTLHLSHGAPHVEWVQGVGKREVHLRVRPKEAPRRALLRAVQNYALGYFGGRIEEYGWMLQRYSPGLELPALHLTNARTRWGSCSRISGIRLNWRLIHLPNAQVDYVVAHELAHLIEMNHSRRFWEVVELLYPDHPQAQAALRNAHKIIPAW